MDDYTDEFFDRLHEGALHSAQVIVPLVQRLVEPTSVVDVGCALGTWLSVFRTLGVHDVVGVDGAYVNRAALDIPGECFHPADIGYPLHLGRRFDLAMSLEVAEHLPESAAEGFIDSLTALAPVILFSAAIPNQGGTNHLNEQWPEYWAERFGARGYLPVDCVRPMIWGHYPEVEWWYIQNTLVFATESSLRTNARLGRAFTSSRGVQLSMVHPACYLTALRTAAARGASEANPTSARPPWVAVNSTSAR